MSLKITSLEDIRVISAKLWKNRPDMQKRHEEYMLKNREVKK